MTLRRLELAAATALLLLAGWLRFYGLAENPPGLFRDEWEKGYTALSLWETGRHGIPGAEGVRPSRLFPLFIEVYEGHDRTSAIYQYISAPIVGLLGLTEGTARLAAAMSGWLAVLLTWLFARRLWGPAGGLIALAVAATHPAGIIFSRWAQQGIMVLPLAIGGAWCWWEALREDGRHRRALALGGGGLLALAAYAYDPARLVVPLLFGWLLLLGGRAPWRSGWKELLPGAALFAGAALLLVVYTLDAGGERLGRVVVGADAQAGLLRTVAGNYLAHFAPHFWLGGGDANPRHGLPGNGFAGAGATLLLLAGLVAGWRRGTADQRRAVLLLGGWLLAGPAAAALTAEGIPHALRAIPMVAPVGLLAGAAALAVPRAGTAARVAVGAVALLLTVDAVRAGLGVRHLRQAPAAAWQTGVLDAIRLGPAGPGGRVSLSAEIPYANYAVLFAELVPPADYLNEGLGAAATIIVFPDQVPPLGPDDVLIEPWAPRTLEDLELTAPSYVIRRRVE